MTSIKLNSVRKSFHGPDGVSKAVFTDLSLEVSSTCFTSVLGANGSGKSTLLNLVARLTTPDAGSIELPGATGGVPKIGYVWQDYRASLLPWLDVLDNLTFPLRLEGMKAEERRKTGESLLGKFMSGVTPKTRCYELSGGQQQLLCLLRSACAHPDVLLLDEPFSALDQQRSWRMAGYVEQVWSERRVPTLFVSHDVDEGILVADEIILLSKAVAGIGHRLRNELPRPRTIKMLNSAEHLRCRKEVIEFLFDDGIEFPAKS